MSITARSRFTAIVIAKEPLPGRVKTRLTPPFTPEQAAGLAAAALADTIDAVMAAGASRAVLAFDGDPTRWIRPGLQAFPQRGDGLDERLAAAFEDADSADGGPLVLVGMDTPQVTATHLLGAVAALRTHDAVLGLAEDGGFWLLGLQRPDAHLLHGVPMSTGGTGAAQQERLVQRGLSVAIAPVLRDVDLAADAVAVAAQAPATRFAKAVHAALETLATV
jgi:rSAM/selenodomain-associated transferase 1